VLTTRGCVAFKDFLSMRSLLSTVALCSSLLAVPACMTQGTGGDVTSSADSAVTAADSASSTSAEGDILLAAVDGANASGAGAGALTANGVSAAISANVSARFTPASCVTVTPGANNTITAQYNDCTGPRGLVHVTGEVAFAVSVSADSAISVHATSTGLKVNAATLDIDATGTYAVTASGPTITVSTTGTGTGALGRNVDHQGNYTLSWNPTTQCQSLDGTWSTELGTHSDANEVNLERCGGGCPTGTVVHTFPDSQQLTITFDGTTTASWALGASATGSAGGASGSASVTASGSFTFSCQ
jgi:hypothetical protein